MTFIVDQPIIQNLGMQGEFLHVKVTFPLYQVNPDITDSFAEQEKIPAGARMVVLKMRAEDLPMHSIHDQALHSDIGHYLRTQFGPYCKRCASPLNRDALCVDETCPYSEHLQNWVPQC